MLHVVELVDKDSSKNERHGPGEQATSSRVRSLVILAALTSSIAFSGCGNGDEIAPLNSPDGLDDSGTGGDTGAGGTDSSMGGGDGDSGAPSPDAPPDPTDFTLLFRDEFDTLDSSRWQLMTHSWAGNLAVFSAQSATVTDGLLKLTLLDAPEGTMSDGGEKQFLGAEVRSRDTLTYGRVRARVRFASGSAVVSSLVTIYTPWPADNWNELDIETLGQDPNHVQFNAMVYTGDLPASTTPVSPTQDPLLVDVGFDVSADFHEYLIEWTPDGARFFIDDVLQRTWTERIDLMNLPQNVLLTIWASGSPGWAGPVTDDTVGATATYDWIELYEYTP